MNFAALGILAITVLQAAADPNVVYTASPLSGEAIVTGYVLPAMTGYLLGAIPFGLILTRFAGLGDIRSIGSGNIGATNVLRTGHKGLAAATLVLDALKGTLAVLIGYRIGALAGLATDASLLAGLGAFVGHILPVWLNFKGGKGVATYIGVILGLYWPAAVFFCAVWLGVAYLTRYSSLSALVASALLPVALAAHGQIPAAALALVMTGLLLWKHTANVKRLLKGEEPRIGAKA
jgi:acyl phosphate:glycerol-3-phosphate acyltransferase